MMNQHALLMVATLSMVVAMLLQPDRLLAQTLQQLPEKQSPLSPGQQRSTFQLQDDLAIELVAAEPDVMDPVAVAWDENGRMYVVEMGDYPTGPPGGRIKLLEDRDGDGRFDRVTVFADKLPFPTSALPWLGGLIVSAAPDIVYLKDTDGDGVADQRTVLFTGFGEGNQQLRVNGLLFGIDNWIYVSNGRSDGSIRQVGVLPLGDDGANSHDLSKTDSKVGSLSIRHCDFRFDLVKGGYERVCGFTQHGHGFDDWGHHFIGWNTVHIRHVVMEQQYLNRAATLMTGVEEISDHGSAARIFPISKTTPRFNIEPAGFVNASCGLTIYRGDVLGPEFRGNSFVCEPLSNVVHRDVLEQAGTTFVARRGPNEQDREFLASTDSWFRPVNLTTGPDGALYVVDFYRAFIEHPQFVRDEQARKSVDWREGSDRGRIWRIKPKNSQLRHWPKLGALTNHELASLLEHPNGWHRDTARRLLIERRGHEAADTLVKIALQSALPQARVHAMRTLDGIGMLQDTVLFQALGDSHPAVREHAVQLSEPRLAVSRKLTGLVTDLADDPDSRVRFQVACTLGSTPPGPESIAALTQIARANMSDKWMRRAVLSCGSDTAIAVIAESYAGAASRHEKPSEDELTFVTELASILSSSNAEPNLATAAIALANKLNVDAIAPWKLALWMGLVNGYRLAHSKQDHEVCRDLFALSDGTPEHLEGLIELVVRQTADERQPLYIRSLGVRLLAHLDWPRSIELVSELLSKPNPPELQVAAVRSLRDQPNNSLDGVYDSWPTLSPAVRRAAVDTILTNADRVGQLAAKLRSGEIAVSDIEPADSERLLSLCKDNERAELQALFARPDSANREQAIEAYRAAITLSGERDRGADLFKKHCTTCHAIQGVGQRVGPDLASVAGRPRDRLLVDILDPSREVGSESYNLVIATKDGRVVSGLLASETDRGITLRRADGVEDSIPRDQIETFRSTGKSLMPEGFERTLSEQDVADLLEFLARGEPPHTNPQH
jgi:putative membrane-bound dehydrogenase-like protein